MFIKDIPAVKVGAKNDRTRYHTLTVHAPGSDGHGVLVVRNNYSGRSDSFSLADVDWRLLRAAIAAPPAVAAEPADDYMGYTREQLEAAFALVRNPENWKLPLDATVPADYDTSLIDAAVGFFTGSPCEFITMTDGVRVTAAGYYACVGS
jgi:hypothetical protein